MTNQARITDDAAETTPRAPLNLLLTAMLLLMITGCAKIPPEAPELSAELGNRISAIEYSNIVLLHRFFDQKRDDIDDFIQDAWVPLFAEEFFSNPQISAAWDTVVRENDSQQRLEFITRLGPKLQAKINAKRLELVAPLDDIERSIEQEIRANYTQARSINNTVTSFLLSASEVDSTRSRYLEMVGITDKKVGNLIDETDNAVSKLVSHASNANKQTDKAKEYLDSLNSIIESAKN